MRAGRACVVQTTVPISAEGQGLRMAITLAHPDDIVQGDF